MSRHPKGKVLSGESMPLPKSVPIEAPWRCGRWDTQTRGFWRGAKTSCQNYSWDAAARMDALLGAGLRFRSRV